MNLKLILGIPLLLLVAIVAFFSLPWLLIFIGIQLEPNPSRPEITHGEFPFRLEYEINGQREVIEDTIICDFDGFGSDEGQGKYRKWKQSLTSGNERITLLKVDDTKEIYYPAGSARYYMGDLKEYEKFNNISPDAAFIQKKGKFTESGRITAQQLFNQYNIKLISWDFIPPITNNFTPKQK